MFERSGCLSTAIRETDERSGCGLKKYQYKDNQ
jgi:hypothetical protein